MSPGFFRLMLLGKKLTHELAMLIPTGVQFFLQFPVSHRLREVSQEHSQYHDHEDQSHRFPPSYGVA